MRTSIKFIPIIFMAACGDGFESSSRTGNETDSGAANGSDFDAHGSEANGGAGGEASGETGGEANGGNSAGGTAGSGPCVPKDCLNLGIELSGGDITAEACGVILDDGCGNTIDCGGCSGFMETCGGVDVIDVYGRDITYEVAPDNICGGSCQQETIDACAYNYQFICNTTEPATPPDPICTPGGPEQFDNTSVWCCPFTRL